MNGKSTRRSPQAALRSGATGVRRGGETSAVAREIRQTRPFRTRAQECLVGLLRTADRVRRELTRVVEPHGVTLQQYNVLRILRGAGEAGLPTLEVGERMIEHAPGITRLLERLDAKGLVTRERGPRDRRQVFVRITPRGLGLLAALDEAVNRADQRSMGGLPDEDVARLVGLLDRLRAGLSDL